jgi:hypothetical protein
LILPVRKQKLQIVQAKWNNAIMLADKLFQFLHFYSTRKRRTPTYEKKFHCDPLNAGFIAFSLVLAGRVSALLIVVLCNSL